ncbi:MAG TPA: glycosyl transferase [Planctomycetales bacterium]|jgi:UDP:flavonoid glycosyltransferase YjiC (YdhE family)|nr:glycosyl transferase [Planctomycetales bacterium]
MHAILATIGTDGDVFPYLGLGARLRARGHRVTLATHEPFRALASDHGFAFQSLVTSEETHAFLNNPDTWHPIKGPGFLARWGAGLIARQYALLAELASDEDAVFAASPGVFAARLVQEKLSRPLATVLLQPWMIPSMFAPPIMPGGLTLPRWAPRPLGNLYWRAVDAVGAFLISGPLHRVRTALGLPPVRRIFQWWLSPQRVLGLFPDWYGMPQSDWPPQLRMTGFPLYDGQPRGGLSPDVRTFCLEGMPPVAFTFGTGMMHGACLFHAAIDACRILGVRGLILTKYGHQLPTSLPSFVRHCEFAPFQELFSHCAVVVHHGGIGTVATALATGTPQLILPLAFDQRDNAMRVKRLGAGDRLSPSRRDGASIAKALAGLMTLEAREKCRLAAAQFGSDDAMDVAVRWLEELAPQ